MCGWDAAGWGGGGGVLSISDSGCRLAHLQFHQHGLHLCPQLVHLVLQLVHLQRVLLILLVKLSQHILILLLQLGILSTHDHTMTTMMTMTMT